jgi:hypothetical protein
VRFDVEAFSGGSVHRRQPLNGFTRRGDTVEALGRLREYDGVL